MAILPGTTSDSQLLGNVVQRLMALRKALEDVADLYGWTSAHTLTDIESLGADPATAAAVLSAVADANALWQIYNTGLPPGSYPQPGSAYVYGQSQRAMIGPQ